MINSDIQDVMNEHLNIEMFTTNLYLVCSNYLYLKSLRGFSKTLRDISEFKRKQVLAINDYLLSRHGLVVLREVQNSQRQDYGLVLDIMSFLYDHEKKVLDQYKAYLDLIRRSKDASCELFYMKIIDQEFELLKKLEFLLNQLMLVEGNALGLLHINDKLLEESTQTI